MLTLMDRTAVADADQALTIMAGTKVAWTTVCAPTITTDGRDSYLLTKQMPSLLAKVPGPAVAACLVELAEQPTTTHLVAGIKQAPASK